MKWRLLILAAVAVAAVAADAAKDDAADKDRKSMEGTWKIESATRGGEEAPAGEIGKIRVLIKDDKLTFDNAGRKDTTAFTLDATKKPHTIDMTSEREKGTAEGIYELDGDTLKLCVSKPGTPRPTEFASKKGSAVILLVLKREKK
jgi:uncharacterized protein (TIGR03067 family)